MSEQSRSELVKTERMQLVHRIVTEGRIFGAITASMVQSMRELSSLDSDDLDYRLLEVHAAAIVLTSCAGLAGSPSIQAYRRLTIARRQLKRFPDRQRAARAFDVVVALNRVPGDRYFGIAKGADAWRERFHADYYTMPVDTVEGVVNKLDAGTYAELVGRTDRPQPPLAVQVATNIERAYIGDEPASDAFGVASQLLRYIVDQPYPLAAS